tara:strand:+ start:1743 stop:1976 length:234 start_codon:yes stop_codon:yes gene_type:complete
MLHEPLQTGQPPLQAGARSTGRGLRVWVVVSFGILEPKISRFAARLMREAPRYEKNKQETRHPNQAAPTLQPAYRVA